MNELPKAYDASRVEDDIYQAWEDSGAFNPDKLPKRNQKGEPYCIMMPPPNRTGTLHIGHAMFLTVEDVMIRFQRMLGKKAVWIPGTDHAAIATQVKVEQKLIKEGMKDPRKELGREKFLEKVVAFAEESATIMRKQIRKMGSSCDWSRERYTLDEPRNRAVNEVFRMMYEDGVIERGYRIVNWDPQFQTTLSDDEVETKEMKAKLLTFRYDADFPIAISTTRPETKFGDTAVAVHPADERYQKYIGQTFTPTFCGKKLSIKIIADEAVDPAFGTGALGVTPAHSLIDADMAVRHHLETVVVIGPDARMLPEVGGAFVGLTTVEAREQIEHALQSNGLLLKVEEISQNLPVAQRGGAAVENLPMRQWFIRVNKPFVLRQETLGKWKAGESVTLKQLMRAAVESGQTKIVPERFEKIYFHWIDNLRDWCISRQIWFGHRIPVWYKGEEQRCSAESPGEGWTQDEDTLDTWFSSGMWTFSALGWPDAKEWKAHRAFHPNAVLETGYDILFFWVARMILMSTYAIGEVPFRDVYLHGLVRDDQGRKMSKSLGNVLDPLDLIPKYGTDAVRLSLIMGTTPGQDLRLSEAKIEGFRNFTNKLWNIGRFVLSSIQDEPLLKDFLRIPVPQTTRADWWIIGRLSRVEKKVTAHLLKYEFSAAGEVLRDFTWGDFADWYLEIAKTQKATSPSLSQSTNQVMHWVLSRVLGLWHPFMPFVTEAIWKELSASEDNHLLMVHPWPELNGWLEDSADVLTPFQEIVVAIRDIRAQQKIAPHQRTNVWLAHAPQDIEHELGWMNRLSSSDIHIGEPPFAENLTQTLVGTTEIFVEVVQAVDVEKEKRQLKKEISEMEFYVSSQGAKITNADFLAKAPPHVVETMRQKIAEAENKLSALKERLQKIGAS